MNLKPALPSTRPPSMKCQGTRPLCGSRYCHTIYSTGSGWRCYPKAPPDVKLPSKDVDNMVEKFPLYLTPEQIDLARDLQREAAEVWNAACTIHRMVYIKYHCWLGEGAIKNFVKGKYGIHSQSAQAIRGNLPGCLL